MKNHRKILIFSLALVITGSSVLFSSKQFASFFNFDLKSIYTQFLARIGSNVTSNQTPTITNQTGQNLETQTNLNNRTSTSTGGNLTGTLQENITNNTGNIVNNLQNTTGNLLNNQTNIQTQNNLQPGNNLNQLTNNLTASGQNTDLNVEQGQILNNITDNHPQVITNPQETLNNVQSIGDNLNNNLQQNQIVKKIAEKFNEIAIFERKCMRGSLIEKLQNKESDEPENIILSIKRKDTRVAEIVSSFLNERGLPYRREQRLLDAFFIRQIRPSEVKELLQTLREERKIESEENDQYTTDENIEGTPESDECAVYLEPDEILTLKLDTSVDYIKGKTVHQRLGVTGRGVKVAILDTGISSYHEGINVQVDNGQGILINKIAGAIDYTAEGTMDENGHGTHVGCITGCKGNYFEGVAPDVQLLNVKTTNKNGQGNMSDTISGLSYAVEQGARIANISLGALIKCDGTDALSRAVDSAYDQGLFVVAAAGNFGPEPSTIATPGCAKKAFTVGAVNESGQITDFSSRGPTADGRAKPNIFAPGAEIASAWYDADDSYVIIDGTSQAAPHVAGVAALLAEARPTLTNTQLKDVMLSTTDPLPALPVDLPGVGIVNAFSAVVLYAEEKPVPEEEPEDEQVVETPEVEEPQVNPEPVVEETVGVQESIEVIEEGQEADYEYQIEDKAEDVSSIDDALARLEKCLQKAGGNPDARGDCSQIFVDSQIKFKKNQLDSSEKSRTEQIEKNATVLAQESNKLKETAKNKLREIAANIAKTMFIGQSAQTVETRTQEVVQQIKNGTITEKQIMEYETAIAEQLRANAIEKYQKSFIPFIDVEEKAWFFPFVDKVKNLKIASGYKDAQGNLTGDFGPGNLTTVAEALKMALESAGEGQSESDRAPKNIKVKDHWAKKYFLRAEELGLNIIQNTSDDPNRFITREEFVRLQLEAFTITALNEFENIFSDVNNNSPFAGFIYQAFEDGIVSGDSGKDTFRPADTINRAEISKIIINATNKYQ